MIRNKAALAGTDSEWSAAWVHAADDLLLSAAITGCPLARLPWPVRDPSLVGRRMGAECDPVTPYDAPGSQVRDRLHRSFALLLPLAQRGPALTLFGAGAFAATFGIVLASVTFASIRQTRCPPQLLGRVQAGSRLLMAITIPLGALAGGTIGQHLGPRTSILDSAIGYTAVGIIAATGPLRQPEHIPAPPEPAQAAAPAPGD